MNIEVTERTGLAVQRAINTVSASGGGRVTLPAGVTVSGTLHLRSHVELHLPPGAVLKASDKLEDYNSPDDYPENYSCAAEEWNACHFIIAHRAEDVSVTGSGVIDGSGSAFFLAPPDLVRLKGTYCWRYGIAWAKDKVRHRPGQMICFVRCRNARVTDVTLTDSPCWSCFFFGSEDVFVRGVRIDNCRYHCNTDGLDFDCCRNVLVSDCRILTGDDAIAIRGCAQRLDGDASPCEHIRVTNCILSSSSSVFRIGVGDGVIRDVQLSGITVLEGSTGLTIQTQYGTPRPGGGRITQITATDFKMENVAYPFELVCGPEQSTTSRLEDVTLRNWDVEFISHARISGQGAFRPKDIRLSNVRLTRVPPPPDCPVTTAVIPEQALSVTRADDVVMEQVSVRYRGVPEKSVDLRVTEASCDLRASDGLRREDAS